MKVLEIGAGGKPQALHIPGWEQAEVWTLDIDPDQQPTILADARRLPVNLTHAFDGILASHVLEHFAWWDTEEVLRSWRGALKPGGEIHIVVPSLEWAARQILSESPSKALIPHLYAGIQHSHDVHMAGFTMRYLRALMERVGLAVTAARSGPYTIIVQGEAMQAEQHYVRGVAK